MAQSSLVPVTLNDFSLPTFQGTTYKLSEQKGYEGFVCVIVSSRCPTAVAYNRRLVKIWELVRNSNMDFQFVFVDEEETDEEIKSYMEHLSFPIPAIDDRQKTFVRMVNAKVIPEIFLFNKNKVLLYRGKIDDNQREEYVTRKNFEEAMAEFLLKKPITAPSMIARGCKIR